MLTIGLSMTGQRNAKKRNCEKGLNSNMLYWKKKCVHEIELVEFFTRVKKALT